MKKYKSLKLIQLIAVIALAIVSAGFVIIDRDLYYRISQDTATMIVCLILWILFVMSFIFLYYDFRNLDLISNNMKAMNFALEADQLSGLANKAGIDSLIAKYSHGALPKDMFCITLTLTNIGKVNQADGQTAGNQLIRVFSDILKETATPDYFLGRNGGSKFIAVATIPGDEAAGNFLSAVDERVNAYNESAQSHSIEYTTGTASPDEGITTMQKLIAASDRRCMLKGAGDEEA